MDSRKQNSLLEEPTIAVVKVVVLDNKDELLFTRRKLNFMNEFKLN
jgi:hypothetical protein